MKTLLLAFALAALLMAQSGSTRLALTQIASYIAVRNETPVAAAAAGTWTLTGTPVAGVACYRNGLRQAPGFDYTLTANSIASAFWMVGDTLICDYEHV